MAQASLSSGCGCCSKGRCSYLGRICKLPDYKPENQFAFGSRPMNRKYALDVIRDAHESWQRIALGNDESEAAHYGVECKNVTLQDSFGYTRLDAPVYTAIPAAYPRPPAPVDPSSEYSSLRGERHTDSRA
jgi:hypothetical protein